MVRKRQIKWIPLPRTEKAEELKNPYCGLYRIFRLYAESIICHDEGISLEEIVLSPSQRICLVEINLIRFNDKSLSNEALDNIEKIFVFFRSQRRQMILRFVYDWEGKGILSEPKDIEIILEHMEQLSTILKSYERDIYIVQGLFIGSWGEMHNSRYLAERHMKRLAKKLYDSTGESTQIALRCPSYWRMIFNTFYPLNDEIAFTEHMSSRFSIYNDGMLASETDFGTYGHIYAKEAERHSDKWIRQDELAFQTNLCKYVSNGGEVINDNEYNDIKVAIEDLRKLRVSYLHSEYDEKVLNKWKANKSGISNPLWRDKSAFEYILAHLGYRYTIKDVKVSAMLDNNNMIKVNIKICNTGFSPSYHKFDVKIALRNRSYFDINEYIVDTDTRFWMPNEIIELKLDIPINMPKKSNCVLCFGIYDPRTQQKIEISNTFSGPDYKGYYSIGNILI